MPPVRKHKTYSLLLVVTIPLATIAAVTAFHPAARLAGSHSSTSSYRQEATTCCNNFATHDRTRSPSSSRPAHPTSSSNPPPAISPSPLRMSLSTEEPISRSRAIGLGLAGWVAGLTIASSPSEAVDPIRKAQEQLRIWGQEDADNVLGGGELASPEGGKTLQPVLALIPIVTLRLQLDEVQADLKNPKRFRDALAIMQTQDFQKKDIKRVFNAYSDNIYYLPDSERENKYLQGGATPSSRQTIQYLLRNDVIDNVEALTAEIAYLIREREGADAGDGGGATPDLDETDLNFYLGKCQGGFDKYLGMVLQNEIDEATRYAKMALVAKKNGSAASRSAPSPPPAKK